MIESKIIEILIGVKVDNAEEIPTKALPGVMRNANNNINAAYTNEIIDLVIEGINKDIMEGISSKKCVIGVFFSLKLI